MQKKTVTLSNKTLEAVVRQVYLSIRNRHLNVSIVLPHSLQRRKLASPSSDLTLDRSKAFEIVEDRDLVIIRKRQRRDFLHTRETDTWVNLRSTFSRYPHLRRKPRARRIRIHKIDTFKDSTSMSVGRRIDVVTSRSIPDCTGLSVRRRSGPVSRNGDRYRSSHKTRRLSLRSRSKSPHRAFRGRSDDPASEDASGRSSKASFSLPPEPNRFWKHVNNLT